LAITDIGHHPAAGGPMAAFALLIGKNLGVKKVPITYRIDDKKRSARELQSSWSAAHGGRGEHADDSHVPGRR
jgi:hypothetical protein